MGHSSDKVAKNIALNLIDLRRKNHLTQEKLAQLAGVTRSSIAQIESGISNPTLEILVKLSSALQVSIDELANAPFSECRHVKFNEIPLGRKSKNGVSVRKLLPDKLRATELDELQIKSGATMTGSPHVQGTKEYFTCIEGQILIAVQGQTFLLKKGDVLSFPGDRTHSYKNIGRSLARGIGVVIFNPL